MKPSVTIMFHTVGLERHKWVYPNISENYNCFADKLKKIYLSKYKLLTLEKVSKQKHSGKTVCLTFDDGYLDNWILVFSLLKKYSLKATIFVNPEFVDPHDIIRPQHDPHIMSQNITMRVEQYAGFLSWPEMREMEKSGLVEIQSHALTHTWYFKGPEIVDFWHPGSATEPWGPVWMLWNRFPEFKPYYLTKAAEYENKIPYGTPVYEHGKSLETRRYEPNEPELKAEIIRYTQAHGNADFFKNRNWKMKLDQIVRDYREKVGKKPNGRYETDSEYKDRITFELTESKRIIELNLKKKVEGICWPGGGVSEEVVRISRDVGYKYFTLPSKWKPEQAKGSYGDMIPRISSGPRILWKGRFLGYPTGRQFLWAIESARGSRLAKWKGKLAKGIQLITSFLPWTIGGV